MGLKHAEREGQRRRQRHDPQQLAAKCQLVRGPLVAENQLTLQRQGDAQTQQHQAQHRIGDKEHTVEFRHFLLILRHLRAGIVAHIRTAQAQAQQGQVGNNRNDRTVYTVLALAQIVHHNRCVDQRDHGA